jgi:hypothetical protein
VEERPGMEWWQVILIVLTTVVLGIFIGILLYYLNLRFILKRDANLLDTLTLLFAPKRLRRRPVVEEQQLEIEEKQNLVPVDLLTEIEYNHKIANQSSMGKVLPLETRVWDAPQHGVNKLPVSLRDELQQVYIDIRMANSLVWLFTEFGRRSPDLYRNYARLCNEIAERLDRIKDIGQAV